MPHNSVTLIESYLVRLWRDSVNSPWRATVHKVRTRETCHFAHPEDLWAYFVAEMNQQAHAAVEPQPRGKR